MGRGCHSIAVKHAYFSIGPSTRGEPYWEEMVRGIEYYQEMRDLSWTPPTWYTNQHHAELGYDWVIKRSNGGWEDCVDVKGIYVSAIRNGSKLVHGVNSAQYSNGGEVQMTYFSDSEADLQDFLNDFFPGETYLDNVAVQQWA